VLNLTLAAVGALGAVVAALSGQLRKLPLSEPLLGLAVGVLLGPAVTGALDLPPLTELTPEFHDGARLLLAVSVMAVALRYPFRAVRQIAGPALLLILVAMVAMAAINTGLAVAVLGLAPATALLLGTALAPTDPVLASSVVTGEPAERDIAARTRRLLSIESGANDGLTLPLVLAALAAAGAIAPGTAVWESLWQVGAAIGLGIALGWLGGRALRAGEEHGATEPTPVLFFTILLALGVLGVASLARADAVLAVFVTGLAFNLVSTGPERAGSLSIDEGVNRFLVLPLFLLFGAALPWSAWADLGWPGLLLVVGVLLLRRLPVLLGLRRPLRLRWADALYLGWFGPIGVAALFYLTLEADRMTLDPVVIAAGSLLVAASTVAHGLTVTVGRRLYRRYRPEVNQG
jgi:sodium/hydrogen antiporter